jgi:hypothetical protein
MRSLILLGLLSVSGNLFAQSCYVNMVDNYNRIIRTFTAYGDQDSCIEGMKECRKSIRLEYSRNPRYPNGSLDCVRPIRQTPTPIPTPIPTPSGMDARRPVNFGETVIFNNRFAIIAGIDMNGLYSVRSNDGWNTMTYSIRRDLVSVTNGCNMGLCVSDSVIDIMSSRLVKIAALSFDDRYVTQSTDGWNTLLSNVVRNNLATTKGCVQTHYSQICVGQTVINRMNQYYMVAGIQFNGNVVLRSTDGWNTYNVNVNPNELVITR